MDILEKLIRISRGITCYQKRWCLHSNIMVSLNGQEAITVITDGGEETPLSVVKPYGIGVPSSEALNTNRKSAPNHRLPSKG